ncbi:hypothetical protein FRC03_006369 [Tulasnella sp. 419]|nr:hypothetical protein FRC03_006369 [Tulasnella sp. 419]
MLTVNETVNTAKDQLMKSLQWLTLLPLVYSSFATTTLTTPSNSSTSLKTTCYFDPFYRLRPSPLPVCSVLPIYSSTDTTPELLSFEEWKQARLLSEATDTLGSTHDGGDGFVRNRTGDSSSEGRSNAESPESDVPPVHDPKSKHIHQSTTGSRVPLTDRFNYAAQDCTARIHSANKQSKSPASILSSKKDKYMLSPCAAQNKFVIVELCDDIRIDTVQLANFEFFSGVFKDFKISLAETTPTDPSGWIDAGIYRAKNVRGVQSFHPPQGRLKFYRYVRIDFLSHYGSEFYCPVSLLRVYGLTHMEDYKWEGWQTEGIPAAQQETPIVEENVEPQQAAPPTASIISSNEQSNGEGDGSSGPSPTINDVVGEESSEVSSQAPEVVTATSAELAVVEEKAVPIVDIPATRVSRSQSTSGEPSTTVASAVYTVNPTSATAADSSTASTPTSASATNTAASSSTPSESTKDSAHVSSARSTASPSSSASTAHSGAASASFSTAAHPSSSGESIYRTIMNRLHILETNSTLSIAYVEEQTRSIRQVVRKLEEDVGRLEGMGKRQQQLLDRALAEMERQRAERDLEMKKVLVEIQTLTKEVTLEKRLGLLQMCLLAFVFIFMTLTRGSRESPGFPASGVAPRRRSRLSRLASWSSTDWARWKQADRDNGDISAPQTPQVPRNRIRPAPLTPRMQSPNSGWHSAAPVSSPSPLSSNITFIPDNSESRPQQAAPVGNNASQQSHTHTSRFTTTPKHRSRVISSPSLPTKSARIQSHSYSNLSHFITSPAHHRKLAPHLHEVKVRRPKSKERHPAKKKPEIASEQRHDDENSPSDGEGTPRIQRSGFGLGMTGVNGAAKGKVVSWKEEQDDEPRTEFVREFSPLSEASTTATCAANESDTESTSGQWEDMSTDDDVEEQGEVKQSRSRHGNWAVSVAT